MKTILGILMAVFVCVSVQAQAIRRNVYTTNTNPGFSLISTNAVAATDTIPVTTDGGVNTFKASVATIRGATSQTPWAGNIDGAGFALTNASNVDIQAGQSYKQNGTPILRTSSTNLGVFVGIGAGALLLNTDTKNTVVGHEAMVAASGGGADSANSAFGYRSLKTLSTGVRNTGIGDGTLFAVTTGTGNTAVGAHAGLNITGSDNTFIGNQSAELGTTGSRNIAIGSPSMHLGTLTGSDNIAMGSLTLGAVSSGTYNVGIGHRVMPGVSTGNNNIGFGDISLFSLTVGTYNISIGSESGYGLGANSGSKVDTYCTFIGYRASRDSGAVTNTTALSNAIAIGKNAKVSASNTIQLGAYGTDALTLIVTKNVIASGYLTATNGIASLTNNLVAPATITIGASPVSWTNTTPVNAVVYVDGVSVTGTVDLNGGTIFNTIGQNTILMQPNEVLTITFTIGTPTAKWKPF